MIVTQGGRRPCGCALYLADPSRKTRSRHPGERRDVARRVSCAAVTLSVSLCLCTGLRGELYHGACCDNKTMKLAQLPISSYPYALYVYCTFPRSVHTAAHRRTVSRSASGLRDLSPGGTHPAHARAGRRHRARRGNGQISSAARPHVPFTITPAHVARAHRASDPRVRSTLGDPHRMCMRPGSVLQHKHGSGRAHGRSRCVRLFVLPRAAQPGRTAPHGHHSHSI